MLRSLAFRHHALRVNASAVVRGMANAPNPLATTIVEHVVRRHPDAPLRPRTAFSFFVKDKSMRSMVIQSSGSEKPNDVFSALGAKWRTLSDGEKQRFVELAVEDRKRFDKEMSEYDGPVTEKVPRKRRNPNAIKRPLTPFSCFVKASFEDVRASMEDPARAPDVMKSLASQWKEMPEIQRKPFVEQSAESRASYNVAKAEAEARMEEEFAAAKAKEDAERAAAKEAQRARRAAAQADKAAAAKAADPKPTKAAATKA